MPPQVYECGREDCPGTVGTAHRADACPASALVGFEFLIELVTGDDRVWARLQGSGGEIGGGALASLNQRRMSGIGFESALVHVLDHNLKRARSEARDTGAVRVWRDHEDPAQRIILTPVRAVLACRERIG